MKYAKHGQYKHAKSQYRAWNWREYEARRNRPASPHYLGLSPWILTSSGRKWRLSDISAPRDELHE